MTRLLFVCMGNICRSPVAEGVMRHLLDGAVLSDRVSVDSAGTGGWHVGEPPDPRTVQAAARRWVHVGGVARQIDQDDLRRHELLLCADSANVRDLLRRVVSDGQPPHAKVRRLREFDPAALALGQLDVRDPYYGEASDFRHRLRADLRRVRGTARPRAHPARRPEVSGGSAVQRRPLDDRQAGPRTGVL